MSTATLEETDVYLITHDALKIMGIKCITTLYKHALCGEIRYDRPTGRDLVFHRGDVVRVTEARKRQADAKAALRSAQLSAK